jgi:YHS domain-containing protein
MRFVLLSVAALCVAAALPGDDAATIAAQKPLYALTTCPVSGKPVGTAGMTPQEIVQDGQLVEFCCGKCKAEFDKSPADYVKKVQDAIVTAQKANYPLDTCPVSGDKLDDKRQFAVVGSKLVELCCNDCRKDLAADPAKFTAKLDQAYMDKQAKDYPLTTCPMSGEPLGDKPVKMLYGTTLVEFCCKDCPGDFMKDPKPALAKIAAARAAKPAAPADKAAKPAAPPAAHGG